MSGRFNQRWLRFLGIVGVCILCMPMVSESARIKDIVSIQGVRPTSCLDMAW